MADEGDARSLRDAARVRDAGGAGALPAGSLHAGGAGDAGTPLAGRQARRPGAAVRRGGAANGRIDGHGDAGGALAPLRRGRVSTRPRSSLLKVAVPVKGRLREPAFKLLEDAGLGPEQPGERALAFPCRNAPVDVLLVRADDIPEYVQDGVVDCGITGLDLVRERAAKVDELLPLGYGGCRLDAAVPEEAPYDRLEDLEGATVATVFPRLARELMPVPVEL